MTEPPFPSASRPFDFVALALVLALATAGAALVLFLEPRPLAVVEVSPRDGAHGVSWRAQVSVTFSRPLAETLDRGSLSVTPDTDGFVSAAGRRAAFTPRAGFRADTSYEVTLSSGLRDRAGRSAVPGVISRFRTQPLGLVLRAQDQGLLRLPRLGSAPEPLAVPRIGPFAVNGEGVAAYVRSGEANLLLESPGGGDPIRRIPLPAGVDVRELEWSPTGGVLAFLAAMPGAAVPGPVYVLRLEGIRASIDRLSGGGGTIDVGSPLLVESLKKSLIEVVYRRESFALTPDGQSVIARDAGWDFAVFGLDGTRRSTLGPYLAVGNTSPRGDAVAVVDVNPADPLLRRQVLVHGREGDARPLSDPRRDSHSPRFANRSDRVVFVTGAPEGPPDSRRFGLELADVPTGIRRPLAGPPEGESDEEPMWSPEDSWILFRRAPVGQPARGRLWIVSPGGGAAVRLPVEAMQGRWSPGVDSRPVVGHDGEKRGSVTGRDEQDQARGGQGHGPE